MRDGRRGEFAAFGWESEQIPDPQARETFERSRLDWAERERSPHAQLLAWHRALIRLRRSRPELADGAYRSVRVAFDAAARWLALRRGDVEVVCNFSAQARDVPVTGACTLLLASRPDVRASAAELRLPPECAAIVLHGEAPT